MNQALAADSYVSLLAGVDRLLNAARRQAARTVNAVLTSTYWEIGRRIIEFEQNGRLRAPYGDTLLRRLSKDLSSRFGRGFSKRNLEQMRLFYLAYPAHKKSQTVSGQLASIAQTLSAQSRRPVFPLSWSHYVLLLSIDDPKAKAFYEAEAERGGWSIRQLDRQIGSQYFERLVLSKNKAAMLFKRANDKPRKRITPEEEIKDPYVLEFLGLKDEYSESDLEEALIRHLEWFLLEMGGEFAFVARQKRLRIGDVWYRIDLMLYHRRLRCLVLIELKLGPLTHSDAGQ